MARIISLIGEGGAHCAEVQVFAILLVKIVAASLSLRSSLHLTSPSSKEWSKRKLLLSRYLVIPSTLSLAEWTCTVGLAHVILSWSFLAFSLLLMGLFLTQMQILEGPPRSSCSSFFTIPDTLQSLTRLMKSMSPGFPAATFLLSLSARSIFRAAIASRRASRSAAMAIAACRVLSIT